MANTFITLQEIARTALPRLMENLVFPNLVYKDFSRDFRTLGDTIRVRKPVALQANDFDAATGVNYQDLCEDSVSVTLDRLASVDARASAIETATNIDDLNRLFIEPAAAALAEKINSDGLALYKQVPGCIGTPGDTPDALSDLAAVRKQLNIQKVPTAGRVAIWDPEADAAFTQIPAIVNAEKSGSNRALREGSIGRIFGLDNYMAQGVKTVTAGITAATAVKLNGAVSEGATTLSIDGTALTGKLLEGDLICIEGKNYIVSEDSATAASNAIANIKLTSALPALADNTDVRLISGGTQNLAFHPMAFAFVTRPLINPDGAGVEAYVTSYNGISLRVTKGYNQQYKQSTYSMDVLYGYKCIYPELALRVLG